MALTQRLQIRQSQALVMTPQLMQAIKLLALTNLDLAAYVEAELERNPLLERGADNEPAEPAPGVSSGEATSAAQTTTVTDVPASTVAMALPAANRRTIGSMKRRSTTARRCARVSGICRPAIPNGAQPQAAPVTTLNIIWKHSYRPSRHWRNG